jgi:hypothetical protein
MASWAIGTTMGAKRTWPQAKLPENHLEHFQKWRSHGDEIVAAVFNRQASLFSCIWHGG